jgi:penicillin-binding protein 2
MNLQSSREDKVPQIKLTVVQYAILGLFLVLAYGLWRLQVAGSDKYESMAERNRVRTVPILAPRGKLLDREGHILVDNYPSFSVLLLRDQVKSIEPDVDKIAAGLNMPARDIRDRVRRSASAPAYEPIILKDDITPDELAFIESHKVELPELETIMVHRRLYPKNGFLAHVIGYVGEVSDDMLNLPQFELYQPGMIVGKSGIEQQYNDLLMGKDGSRRVVVNTRGKEVDRLSETAAVPGKQLKLTIDLDMQIAAEEALGDLNGAIVAMDPHNGEILAMVSRPAFDPNAFAVRITRQEWTRLVTDEGKPLMNKAIQAQLAPGSVFKILMSVAGLQEGIAQTLHVNCGGGAVFYGRYFNCWVKSAHLAPHGGVDITKGIYQSCDVFFYTLGERLGIGRIAKYASMFGLGKRTGIDLPQEVSGTMPSEEWKIKNFKQKWYAGETISVSIGQGAVTVTPVQLTRAIAGVAMGGTLRRPHLVFDDEVPPDLQRVNANYPDELHADIDPQNWQTITDAMAQVTEPIGTAPSAHLQGIDFAGKTGSSQVVSNAARKLLKGKEYNDNSWFVGFTPRRDPSIVVGVLFEGGEHGKLAARIAAQVVKAYVEKQRALEATRKAAAAKADPPKDNETKPAPPKSKVSRNAPLPNGRPGGIAQQTAVQMTGLWEAQGDGQKTQLKAARFRVPIAPAAVVRMSAAPGMGGIADLRRNH